MKIWKKLKSPNHFIFLTSLNALRHLFQRREPFFSMHPSYPSLSVFHSHNCCRKSLLPNCAPFPAAEVSFQPLLSAFSSGHFRRILLKHVSICTTSSLQPLLMPTITVNIILSLLPIFFPTRFSCFQVRSITYLIVFCH